MRCVCNILSVYWRDKKRAESTGLDVRCREDGCVLLLVQSQQLPVSRVCNRGRPLPPYQWQVSPWGLLWYRTRTPSLQFRAVMDLKGKRKSAEENRCWMSFQTEEVNKGWTCRITGDVQPKGWRWSKVTEGNVRLIYVTSVWRQRVLNLIISSCGIWLE